MGLLLVQLRYAFPVLLAPPVSTALLLDGNSVRYAIFRSGSALHRRSKGSMTPPRCLLSCAWRFHSFRHAPLSLAASPFPIRPSILSPDSRCVCRALDEMILGSYTHYAPTIEVVHIRPAIREDLSVASSDVHRGLLCCVQLLSPIGRTMGLSCPLACCVLRSLPAQTLRI
jgi:hypothetical protein